MPHESLTTFIPSQVTHSLSPRFLPYADPGEGVPQLDLSEFLAYQSISSSVHMVTHSPRCMLMMKYEEESLFCLFLPS